LELRGRGLGGSGWRWAPRPASNAGVRHAGQPRFQLSDGPPSSGAGTIDACDRCAAQDLDTDSQPVQPAPWSLEDHTHTKRERPESKATRYPARATVARRSLLPQLD